MKPSPDPSRERKLADAFNPNGDPSANFRWRLEKGRPF
jgi:hypothetical protein